MHIILAHYIEWLPIILGEDFFDSLVDDDAKFSKTFNSKVSPSIYSLYFTVIHLIHDVLVIAFATPTFRFWNSLIKRMIM